MRSSVRIAPAYRHFGVNAVLDLGDGREYAIRALDKTVGVSVGTPLEVQTTGPAAMVRATEFADLGIDPDGLEGATMLLGDRRFDVTSVRPVPAGRGESDGEYCLYLSRVS